MLTDAAVDQGSVGRFIQPVAGASDEQRWRDCR
jgi:hypothetical protein